jgi:hypothetical protein
MAKVLFYNRCCHYAALRNNSTRPIGGENVADKGTRGKEERK